MSNKPTNGPEYLFEKTQEIKKQKEERKTRKRITIISVIFILLFLVFVYFSSNLSKIKSIQIKGINYLSEQDILEKVSIKENDYKILLYFTKIEEEIESLDYVSDCMIHHNFNGVVDIIIIEKRPIAYYKQNEDFMILFDDNTSKVLETKDYKIMLDIPSLTNFNQRMIESIIEPLKKIDPRVLANISSIDLYPLSYDPNTVVCHFDDGNYTLCNINILEKNNNYYTILEKLKVQKSCIFFDSTSDNAFTMDCPWIENEVEIVDDQQIEDNENN